MDAFNRWEHMITSLGPSSMAVVRSMPMPRARQADGPRRGHRGDAPTPSSGDNRRRCAIVTAERQTDSSMLVSWSDPTHCRYDEQRWISAKARGLGRCALTGMPIRWSILWEWKRPLRSPGAACLKVTGAACLNGDLPDHRRNRSDQQQSAGPGQNSARALLPARPVTLE